MSIKVTTKQGGKNKSISQLNSYKVFNRDKAQR